ncbi:hypothetical protein [Streptomyces varsoviensis]|uniref:SH3b domain-containing protein n=1 Tax=Streptomyces varsoviensis TaxID=67373 RepID=A0ABR5IZJ3_9ACTN|nr:hypothetical protein [Streptomyces varsoviensis]KOG86575.1 hypothetical protein ADK38_30250 [Streptomyces varsoviensis]
MNLLTKRARFAVAATTPLLLLGAAITATAPAAQAASAGINACTHPGWSNKSPGKGKSKSGKASVRSGPNKGCTLLFSAGRTYTLYYHCWVKNSAGHKWTHLRVDSEGVSGWVYNKNLDDGGSVHPDNKC